MQGPRYHEVNRRNNDSRTPIEYVTRKWREAKADVHTKEDAAFLAFFVVMETFIGIIVLSFLVLALFNAPLVIAGLAVLFIIGYMVYLKVRPKEGNDAA